MADFEFGLGRNPSPDARDGLYPMRAVLGSEPITRTGSKFWSLNFPPLNQGLEGTCVGHGWKHFLLHEPIVQAGPNDDPTAVTIYDRATEIDEWQGNEHDRTFGTSTRAGASVLRERGLVAEYRHAQNLNDILDWLAVRGPIVIGVNWYEGMAYRGMFDGPFLVPTGELVGGHCVCVSGVNFDEGWVEICNSWGPNWGPLNNGRGRIRFADLDRLIFREGGDAIATLEVALGPTPPPEPPAPEPEPDPPAPEPPTPPTPPEPPAPQGPYQETIYKGYDRERDMWIWEFRIQRHTGGWD